MLKNYKKIIRTIWMGMIVILCLIFLIDYSKMEQEQHRIEQEALEKEKEEKNQELHKQTVEWNKIAKDREARRVTKYIKPASANIRKEPNVDSEIITNIKQNEKIECLEIIGTEWYECYLNGEIYYIHKDCLSDDKIEQTKNTSISSNGGQDISDSGFKSYMPYTAVTSRSSAQYKLLNSNRASTDDNGLRLVDGRYCIAIGSGWGANIGSYVDIYLENGNILPCIMGDQKADIHTDTSNKVCLTNGSVVEFIVDYSVFKSVNDGSGTVNFVNGFDSKVVKVVVH